MAVSIPPLGSFRCRAGVRIRAAASAAAAAAAAASHLPPPPVTSHPIICSCSSACKIIQSSRFAMKVSDNNFANRAALTFCWFRHFRTDRPVASSMATGRIQIWRATARRIVWRPISFQGWAKTHGVDRKLYCCRQFILSPRTFDPRVSVRPRESVMSINLPNFVHEYEFSKFDFGSISIE